MEDQKTERKGVNLRSETLTRHFPVNLGIKVIGRHGSYLEDEINIPLLPGVRTGVREPKLGDIK